MSMWSWWGDNWVADAKRKIEKLTYKDFDYFVGGTGIEEPSFMIPWDKYWYPRREEGDSKMGIRIDRLGERIAEVLRGELETSIEAHLSEQGMEFRVGDEVSYWEAHDGHPGTRMRILEFRDGEALTEEINYHQNQDTHPLNYLILTSQEGDYLREAERRARGILPRAIVEAPALELGDREPQVGDRVRYVEGESPLGVGDGTIESISNSGRGAIYRVAWDDSRVFSYSSEGRERLELLGLGPVNGQGEFDPPINVEGRYEVGDIVVWCVGGDVYLGAGSRWVAIIRELTEKGNPQRVEWIEPQGRLPTMINWGNESRHNWKLLKREGGRIMTVEEDDDVIRVGDRCHLLYDGKVHTYYGEVCIATVLNLRGGFVQTVEWDRYSGKIADGWASFVGRPDAAFKFVKIKRNSGKGGEEKKMRLRAVADLEEPLKERLEKWILSCLADGELASRLPGELDRKVALMKDGKIRLLRTNMYWGEDDSYLYSGIAEGRHSHILAKKDRLAYLGAMAQLVMDSARVRSELSKAITKLMLGQYKEVAGVLTVAGGDAPEPTGLAFNEEEGLVVGKQDGEWRLPSGEPLAPEGDKWVICEA